METRKYKSGEAVIRQGDPGEEFFLVGRGAAAVTMQNPGEPERQVATLGPGDVFGEMALLTDEPRNATVRAVEDMEAFCLGKKDFRDALERSVGFKEQIRQIYFDRYPVLRKASA
jgi:CRP-like cAMP-binding protein